METDYTKAVVLTSTTFSLFLARAIVEKSTCVAELVTVNEREDINRLSHLFWYI